MGGFFFICVSAIAFAVLVPVADWLGDWIEVLQDK